MNENVVDATLEGGPVHFPAELRSCRVAETQEKVKVEYLGGHEHFERDTGDDGATRVYRWTGRTRVAE